MPAHPRKDLIDPDEIGIYHCYSRCVRRAFLCGADRESGDDNAHRKLWLMELTSRLAAAFAIDVLDFCMMDNHIHHVLRNRPDLAEQWSDEEVARRWWQLHPLRKNPDGSPAAMTEPELNLLLNSEKLPELRRRLSDISWFMKELKEPIAKRANRDDGVTGHFWEGRFRSTRLLDEAAVLACCVYVNLNMIRAGSADCPERSHFTSVWQRIQATLEANGTPWVEEPTVDGRHDAADPIDGAEADAPTSSSEPSDPSRPAASTSPLPKRLVPQGVRFDAWLAPVDEAGQPLPAPEYRASDLGYLPMPLDQFLELLDWSGRQLSGDKRGAIPASLPPILERLGLPVEGWLQTLESFHQWFPRAMGRAGSLVAAAASSGRRWFHGLARCRDAFPEPA